MQHLEDSLEYKVQRGWGFHDSLETLLKHLEDSLEYKVSRGLGFNDSLEALLKHKHLEDSLQHASQYPFSTYLETVQMLCGRKGVCAFWYHAIFSQLQNMEVCFWKLHVFSYPSKTCLPISFPAGYGPQWPCLSERNLFQAAQ